MNLSETCSLQRALVTMLGPQAVDLHTSETQQLQHTPAFEGVSSAVDHRRAGGLLPTLQLH